MRRVGDVCLYFSVGWCAAVYADRIVDVQNYALEAALSVVACLLAVLIRPRIRVPAKVKPWAR